MDLGAELARALPGLRAQAESRMEDTVRLESVGEPVTDEWGNVTAPRTLVYEGPGRWQTYEPQESNPEAGGSTMTVQRYALHIPVGSCRPAIGLVATAVTGVHDPYLAGREFRVVALLHKTAATAYRLGVEET